MDNQTNTNIQRKEIDKKIIFLFLMIIFLLTGIIGINRNSNFYKASNNSIQTPTFADSRVQAPPVLFSQKINKNFQFSLKNEIGKEIGKIDYSLESAQTLEEIYIKGELARAISGKKFLIVNLKIKNDNNSGIQINTRNYLRLSVNGNLNEWLAPDIHNDPVEIQAISTKLTRIGFPINDTDKNLLLQVGEINGKKETVKLNLK